LSALSAAEMARWRVPPFPWGTRRSGKPLNKNGKPSPVDPGEGIANITLHSLRAVTLLLLLLRLVAEDLKALGSPAEIVGIVDVLRIERLFDPHLGLGQVGQRVGVE